MAELRRDDVRINGGGPNGVREVEIKLFFCLTRLDAKAPASAAMAENLAILPRPTTTKFALGIIATA